MYRTPAKPVIPNEDSNTTVTLAGSETGAQQNIAQDRSQLCLTPTKASQRPNPAVRRLSVEMTRKAVAEGLSKPKPAAVASKQLTKVTECQPRIETGTYPDITSEAEAVVRRIKANLNLSGNLRRDVKAEVHFDIDHLCFLVEKAETNVVWTPRSQMEEEVDLKDLERMMEKQTELIKEGNKIAGEQNDKMMQRMEKHSRIIEESSEKMEALRREMERQKETLDVNTYASVAAGRTITKAPERVALHSVVVTSKNENETGEEVLNRIRKAVNAKEGGINIERVRKAKDRKVIVGCKTKEERIRVKERLAGAEFQLTVEDIQNKDPLVILKDVLQLNSDEEVQHALRKQNGALFRDLEKEDDRFELAYKRRTRNPHANHIVLRVSPRLWQRMMDAGSVHVDLQRVRVADQSPLVQCSRCLGYGHGRRFCTDTLSKCSHCGGPHIKTACPEFLAGSIPNCCNCSHAKFDDTEHNAFSTDCPIRKKWDALARAKTAYC